MSSDTPSPARADSEPRARGRPGGKPSSGGAETKSDAEGAPEAPKKVVRMGKYEIGQHIATGGMGFVYRARDVETGREVALKILKPDTAAKQPALLERFKREARSAAKLEHENIVRVLDFGEVAGAWYLAMEFVDGVDLHDYVKSKGAIGPEEARQIILQGARALKLASEHNIVHRDIKPSNFLLLRRHGRPFVKLTDFGLAREVTSDEFRVTRAGTTVGTVDYMSPEQARDSSAADIRSDLYSLGTTWYHLLTGQAPFPDGGLGERLIKIMTEPPPDVRELNPRVSDDCWFVLSKLLEKDPDERFQTPDELIDALLALEGKAVAGASSGRAAPKKKARKPRSGEKKSDAAAPEKGDDGKGKKGSKMPYLVGGLAAVVVVGALVAALVGTRKPAPRDDGQASVRPPVQPSPGPGPGPQPDKDRKSSDGGKKPPSDGGKKPPEVKQPRWPALSPASARVDVRALRAEVEKPWADRVLGTDQPVVVQVRRAGGTGPRSLSEAVTQATATASAGRALIVEIHDNGPLFVLPLALEDRHLTIRAGKGFRPLLLWDLPATVEQRRRARKTDPLVFLTVRKGNLRLEGLEVALRWPDNLAEAATLLDVAEGGLEVDSCTISAAGKPREPITLARFRGGRESARCRFTRLHARGAGLTALDLQAPAAEVLLDGCLIVGGQQPLLRLAVEGRKGPHLRLVRSTLVCEKTCVELKPAGTLDRSPGLHVLAWDSLLSRTGSSGTGDLLALRDGADARGIDWRAVNSLYAGWKNLLAGTTTLSADRVRDWRSLWKRIDGDEVVAAAWPEALPVEPASQPAAALLPGKSVGFASSVDPEQPLGCDLSALPACRDHWLGQSLDPTLTPVDVPGDPTAPEIPAPGDNKYHGERIDLSTTDLGAHLANVLRTMKPGPRIVLHLSGKGDHSSSPIQLKGSSLVLFFEEPADDKSPRTALKLATTDGGRSLIEVEDGSVEVVAGVLKLADTASSRGSHLMRVKGGDVKLYRTRLEGPQQTTPIGWKSAVCLVGTGDPAADRARAAALNECVVLSSRAGVLLEGTGSRLSVRQSLIVAGSDAVQLLPSPDCKGRANIQCFLQQSTVAARQAIVRVGDAGCDGPPADPVIVSTRDCALLSPFPGQKAGLLVCEGKALTRGLVLWQGEREALDQRLFFTARGSDDPLPARRQGLADWQQLWGSYGVKQPRPEVKFLLAFDPKRWALERLVLRMPDAPGADLGKLAITAGKPR